MTTKRKALPAHKKLTAEQRQRAGKAYAEAAWGTAGKGPTDGTVTRLARAYDVSLATIEKCGQVYLIATMAKRIEELLASIDWPDWQNIYVTRNILWGYPPREHVPTIEQLQELADEMLHRLVNPRQGPVIVCGGLIARRDFDGNLELEIEP